MSSPSMVHSSRQVSTGARDGRITWLAVLMGLAIWFVVNRSLVSSVWQSNNFLDTDDAMRLVEMRDFLNGQNWFDLTQWRMDPPLGVQMHWSRLLDVPLAAIYYFFRLGFDADHAERLMRISAPALLFMAMLGLMLRIGWRIFGREGAIISALLAILSPAVSAFLPGAIDHHGLQCVMTLGMIALTLEAAGSDKRRHAVLAALTAAVSLQISLETLPFVATMIAIFAVLACVHGAKFAARLTAFAVSLPLSMLALMVLTIRPAEYDVVFYDAFSSAHVGAALIGGAGLLLFSALLPRLAELRMRIVVLALCGSIAMAVILLLFPGFLHAPMSEVPTLMREEWLNRVEEGQSLLSGVRADPTENLPPAVSFALCTLALLIAGWKSRGADRERWFMLAGFALMGDLFTLWQLRVGPIAAPVMQFGISWAFVTAIAWAEQRRGHLVKLVPFLVVVPFLGAVWGMALPRKGNTAEQASALANECGASSAFTALRALPKGTILSYVDAGSNILALTEHNTVTGPYHRDIHGMMLAIKTWRSPPDQASGFAHETGATYLAYCEKSPEIKYRKSVKGSLAAALADGDVPSWLDPIALPDTPFKVFRIR